MALTRPRTVTARRIAANRRNARKSTGPRTAAGKRRSSLNAGKSRADSLSTTAGKPATPCKRLLKELVAEIGEDPRVFGEFRRSLVDALQPTSAVEAQLVDDLAGLWWKKARLDRAQAALQWREIEKLEADHLHHYHQTSREPFEHDMDQVREVGLRGQHACLAKFDEAYLALDELLSLVDRGEWTEKAERLSDLIYGEKPNWRGYRIRQILKVFRESREESLEDQDEEEEAETPAPDSRGGEQEEEARAAAPDSADEKEVKPSKDLLKELRILILQEMSDVAVERQMYRKEFLEITPAMRRSCLAPTDARWPVLVRQDASVERQIDRKLKLYLLTKRTLHRMDVQLVEDLFAGASKTRANTRRKSEQKGSIF